MSDIKMDVNGITEAEAKLKDLLIEISQARVKGGRRASALSRAREIWEPLPWEARRRVLDACGVTFEDALDFSHVAELVSGYRRRTVRRNIEIWRNLKPSEQESWRAGTLSFRNMRI